MQEHYAKFMEIKGQIDSVGATLDSEVGASRSHFKGEAATAFQAVMSRYETDRRQLNQVLETMAEAIRTSGQNFHSQDAASSAALRSAGSGLKA